jgi:DNA-binding PadR family transcriptional regulator
MPPTRPSDAWPPLTPALFHVLMCLADGDRHGYRILKEVAERTAGRVELSTGTLYGIIKRLLDEGLAVEVASGSERRRAYHLTPKGRRVARAEARRLEALVTSARSVRLLPAPKEGGES